MSETRMTDAVIAAYREFRRAAPDGPHPTALRLHPDDWDRLRYEMHRTNGMLSPDAKRFMGMVPLIDPNWMSGFPSCLDPQAAADAIERGAWAANA